MTPEVIEIWLAVCGWLVAFLLGKELATGFVLWRASRGNPTRRRS